MKDYRYVTFETLNAGAVIELFEDSLGGVE